MIGQGNTMRKFSLHTVVSGIFLLAAGCNGGDEDITYNEAPVADAGDAVTQPADDAIHLDGRASYDQNGDILTYHWTLDHIPSTSSLNERIEPFSMNHTLEGATSFQPDVVGTYIVKLEVYDGSRYSEASFVVINATDPENAPVADAGADQMLALGATATLDGSQSVDPLGGLLQYQWALVEVPYGSGLTGSDMADVATVQPSFTGDVGGWYTATLMVNNGLSYSSPDSVRVHLQGENEAPLANAGGDITGSDCSHIQLDCGGSSDPEGEALAYWWVLQSKPNHSQVDNRSFTNQTIADPTFYPDVAGTYTASCSVFDGHSWSYPDTITLDVGERTANTPPIANAGGDQEIDAGTVDCEKSGYYWNCGKCPAQAATIGVEASDSDGDPVVVEWRVAEESSGSLIGADAVPAKAILDSFGPDNPGVCEEVDFEFVLAVTDCPGTTTEDTVTVTVSCCGIED